MKKLFILPLWCFCLLLGACAGSQSASPHASLPASSTSELHVPGVPSQPLIFVEVVNATKMQEDLAGTVALLMQSEYGAQKADSVGQADYHIHITIDAFGQAGSETSSPSTSQMVLPGLAGAALGAQVGGAFSGNGTLVGAGIGLVAGLSLGSMSGTEELLVWYVNAVVKVTDKKKKVYSATLRPQEKGENMSAQVASASLENTLAWSVVRAFAKD